MNRRVAVLLGAGGLLVAIGGMLHPVADGDTLTAALAGMTGDRLWVTSHLLVLVGLVVALVGLAEAYRRRTFGRLGDLPLRFAVWAFAFAALELVPHVLAVRDHDELAAGEVTGLVRLHLVLQALAGPALALSTIVLAVAVARTARTRPAWALAGAAALGGAAYALAGPLVALTEDPRVAVLFAGELGVAVWLVGTGVRLARSAPDGLTGAAGQPGPDGREGLGAGVGLDAGGQVGHRDRRQ